MRSHVRGVSRENPFRERTFHESKRLRRAVPRRTLGYPWLVVFSCVWPLWLSGCLNLGKFVWVDQYEDKPSAQDPGYVVRSGDVLNVVVWNQQQLTTKARVREDGRISMMFLNDVDAAGYKLPILAQQLQTRLKDYINNPVVTVSLEETRPIQVSVLGEVTRTGMLLLDPSAGLLQALSQAGGFTEYAHKDAIFVLRKEGTTPEPVRIRFTYQALIHTEGRAAAFRLRGGDVVVVE